MSQDIRKPVENKLNRTAKTGGQSDIEVLKIVNDQYRYSFESHQFTEKQALTTVIDALNKYAIEPSNKDSRPAVDSALKILRTQQDEIDPKAKEMNQIADNLTKKVQTNLTKLEGAACHVSYNGSGSLECFISFEPRTVNEENATKKVKDFFNNIGLPDGTVEGSHELQSGRVLVLCSFDPITAKAQFENKTP